MIPFRRRLRSIALSGLTLSAALLVALLLTELLVRAVMPQQLILVRPDVWQPVDTLGWMLRPNIHTTINTGERTVAVVTDADGFRIGRSATPGTGRRILLLGDSFMEAVQVEYEQSVAGLLEADLTRRLAEPVRVYNAGVSGWEPSQYLLKLRRELERRPIDAVVVAVYSGNDALPRRTEYFAPRVETVVHRLRIPRDLSSAELIDAVAYPVNDFLERRSHLFVLFKREARTMLMRARLSYFVLPQEVLRREAGSPRWSVSADVCRDMQATAERARVPIVFMLIPSDYQVDPRVLTQYAVAYGLDSTLIDPDQPNRLLGAELARRGVEAVDLLPPLREAFRRGGALYGKSDYHFTPEGHRVVASLIAPLVAARLGERGIGVPQTQAADTTSGPRARAARPGLARPALASGR
jgi:hypothetical protein